MANRPPVLIKLELSYFQVEPKQFDLALSLDSDIGITQKRCRLAMDGQSGYKTPQNPSGSDDVGSDDVW